MEATNPYADEDEDMTNPYEDEDDEPAVEFVAMDVRVEKLPDEEKSDTHTESGGYRIEAIGAEKQRRRVFRATALNINGMAIAGNFTIGEYDETVTITKDQADEGGYLNFELSA